jgi:hypothetical protein
MLQMVKPLERNTRYVDAVLTIPKGTLYPMCGMNLAFDRGLIGPAMYFGLMGEGQPLGRYDDMWAGWCSKVRRCWQSVIISISSSQRQQAQALGHDDDVCVRRGRCCKVQRGGWLAVCWRRSKSICSMLEC